MAGNSPNLTPFPDLRIPTFLGLMSSVHWFYADLRFNNARCRSSLDLDFGLLFAPFSLCAGCQRKYPSATPGGRSSGKLSTGKLGKVERTTSVRFDLFMKCRFFEKSFDNLLCLSSTLKRDSLGRSLSLEWTMHCAFTCEVAYGHSLGSSPAVTRSLHAPATPFSRMLAS